MSLPPDSPSPSPAATPATSPVPESATPTAAAPRLLDALRERIRYLHYSLRTEAAYVHWVRAFIHFHQRRHPSELGQPEVEAFLSWLAHDRQVAPATHQQALSALLFLYQKVLHQHLPWMADIGRPQGERRLPVVLSADEVAAVLAHLDAQQLQLGLPHGLIGRLLYGTGMRLLEGLRLRVKDIDFDRRAIVVREGKGAKDRVVMLPAALEAPLARATRRSPTRVWAADRAAGLPGVHVPHALARKYPRAAAVLGLALGLPAGRSCRSTRAAPACAATTCSRATSSASSRPRCKPRRCTSRPRRTRCATRSPPTCCRPATTSAPCRNCWAMPTSAPR